MSAGRNATMLNNRPMKASAFDCSGGALIRCIGWLN